MAPPLRRSLYFDMGKALTVLPFSAAAFNSRLHAKKLRKIQAQGNNAG